MNLKQWGLLVLKTWKPGVGGILVGVPPLITAAGFVLSPAMTHWLNLCQGLGALLLGLSVKANTTHSTLPEMKAATEEAEAKVPLTGA